ncbi:hypothetical protein TNCV_1446571 [Trichonephila clavipes]|nr:hypothetical protein TNCV_1446571 [Trichonephila clavipes]
MTRSVTKRPRVAEQCDANIHSLTRKLMVATVALVAKVTVSRLACHEIEHSTTEDPLCRSVHCTLNLSRFKLFLVGVVKNLGECVF